LDFLAGRDGALDGEVIVAFLISILRPLIPPFSLTSSRHVSVDARYCCS
jgi:hypothetical protein